MQAGTAVSTKQCYSLRRKFKLIMLNKLLLRFGFLSLAYIEGSLLQT